MSQDLPVRIKYRCVCGADVEVEPPAGGNCDQCDREISQPMLLGDVTQTIVLDGKDSGTRLNVSSSSSPIDDEKMLDKCLEHFRIVRRLGRGGMGTVYMALDESLQRYVALKVIANAGTQAAETNVQRLLEEARAQARVNHPNVVHIYYVSRSVDEMPFLAMELIDGPTLATRMKQKSLHYEEVVVIGAEVTEALRQSARFDIAHGDIKPSNILLLDGKTAKLSDFGLSKRISVADDATATISGTPSYMAPELFDGVQPNEQTDQYALGVMLFEMTFGRLPFELGSGTVTGAMTAHRTAPVEFPEPWPNSLPIVWRSLLMRLLEKDPKDRFETFDEVGYRLFHARPHRVRAAGRLVRAMAWTLDSLICLSLVSICIGIIGLLNDLVEHYGNQGWLRSLSGALAVSLALAVPAFVSFVQSRWGTTPGKKLMQIRIVDEHGLRPNRWRLALRAVPQFLACWALLYSVAIELVVPEFVAAILAGVLAVSTGVDALVAAFGKRGRSIHDWFFNTRVVLDDGAREASM